MSVPESHAANVSVWRWLILPCLLWAAALVVPPFIFMWAGVW